MKKYNIIQPNLVDYPAPDSTQHHEISKNFHLFWQYVPDDVRTTCEIAFWNTGGANEQKTKFGGGQHLLEHLVAMKFPKATEKFGAALLKLNARTATLYTGYNFSTYTKNTLGSLDFLIDVLNGNNITEENINHEKKVIVQEAAGSNSQLINTYQKRNIQLYPDALGFTLPVIGMTDLQYQKQLDETNLNIIFPRLNLVQDITKQDIEIAYNQYKTKPVYVCMRGNLIDQIPQIIKKLESSHLNTKNRLDPINAGHVSLNKTHIVGSALRENEVLLSFEPTPLITSRDEVLLRMAGITSNNHLNNIMREKTKQPVAYSISGGQYNFANYHDQFLLCADTTQREVASQRMLRFAENSGKNFSDKDTKLAIDTMVALNINTNGIYDFDAVLEHFTKYGSSILTAKSNRSDIDSISPQDVRDKLAETVNSAKVMSSLVVYTDPSHEKDAKAAHETIQKHFNL